MEGPIMEALVVFKDETGHPLNFLLKKGFKHCFICVKSGAYWIEVDIIRNVPHIKVMTGSDYDMQDFYMNQGFIVVKTRQRVSRPSRLNIFYGSLMVANCVGLVKTILAVNTLSWTPYSLYKELTE